MRAVILAAGYATRLYPLTLDKPKALLPVKNKPIIDYIIEKIETLRNVDKITVVTNGKFYDNFLDWRSRSSRFTIPVSVLNDGTTDESNKFGAIGDISYAIVREKIDDDLLVIAGDNLFTYSLHDFYEYAASLNEDCICVKEFNDMEAIKHFGTCSVDSDNRVISFEEKSENPKSNLAVYATYFFKRETLPLIDVYLRDKNKPDAPGYFIEWLYKRKNLFAFRFDGECYDIGTKEAYEHVCGIF